MQSLTRRLVAGIACGLLVGGRAGAVAAPDPDPVLAPKVTRLITLGTQGGPRPSPERVFVAHDIPGPGLVYKDANIKVTAAENCHFHFPKGSPGYGWQQSFAFRFQTPDRVIVFSGDTGACGDAIVNLAKGADILVH